MTLIDALARRGETFFQEVLAVFQKPFYGLSFVVWFYFVLAYAVLPFNPTWLGSFPDSDNYTYLIQTLDWLQGQGWFDNVQQRMNPPEGVAIHYTRFAQIPIAGLILLFRFFNYSWQGAALLAAFLLPVLYLGLFLGVLRVVAERFVAKDWSRLTAFIALFAAFLTFKFAPSQIDHHGLVAILVLAGIGFTTKIFHKPFQASWAFAASGALALSTAIALEALPWMILTSAVVGLWTVAVGEKATRAATAFGLGLYLSSAILLVLSRGAEHLLVPDLLSYSIAYVALMGGIATALFGAALTTFFKSVKIRVLLSSLIAAVLGLVYLHYFPAFWAGPYGAMDPKLAELFFSNISEALPMTARYKGLKMIAGVFLPALALIVSCFRIRSARGHKKWNWTLLACLLAASLVLSVFYQVRIIIYAQLFAIIPLASFAEHGWKWIGGHFQGRPRFWAEIFLILLIGPLATIFLPAIIDGRSFNIGVLLFPAQTVDNTCDVRSVSKFLSSPPYGDRKLRIMNVLCEGAELVFFTPHEVMASPYHTNVKGNLAALEFFSTTDPSVSMNIAKENAIDLVVLCHKVPDMYLDGKEPNYEALPNGLVRMRPNKSLAGQLAEGKIPAWMKNVPVPYVTNFSVYEIDKAAFSLPSKAK